MRLCVTAGGNIIFRSENVPCRKKLQRQSLKFHLTANDIWYFQTRLKIHAKISQIDIFLLYLLSGDFVEVTKYCLEKFTRSTVQNNTEK